LDGPFLRAPKQVEAPINKIHKTILTKFIEVLLKGKNLAKKNLMFCQEVKI
jgi:hypothetical protein